LSVSAQIDAETQTLIRLDRVCSGVLQCIGADLVDDADPSSFLLLVNDRSTIFFRSEPNSLLKLLAAIALCRAKNVAGKALRVNPNKGRPVGSEDAASQLMKPPLE
jgi:hypothetical protein